MKFLFWPESYWQVEGRTEVLMGKVLLIFRVGPVPRRSCPVKPINRLFREW